jgi:hypothetical protein
LLSTFQATANNSFALLLSTFIDYWALSKLRDAENISNLQIGSAVVSWVFRDEFG